MIRAEVCRQIELVALRTCGSLLHARKAQLAYFCVMAFASKSAKTRIDPVALL